MSAHMLTPLFTFATDYFEYATARQAVKETTARVLHLGGTGTIWYAGDYLKRGATTYSTRIGAFRLPGCGAGRLSPWPLLATP